jgi:hypothetical protein
VTIKEELTENIKRLEVTIAMNIWNKGYVENCKENIKSYKNSLKNLK